MASQFFSFVFNLIAKKCLIKSNLRLFCIVKVFLFVSIAHTFSQEVINLVPNPSFEEFENGCPENLHEIPLHWSWWRDSPNSFSTCVDPQNLLDSLGWAPWTGFGTQMPAHGESFCGFYSHGQPEDSNSSNFREYLGCELLEPLEVGNTYYVSFKVSTGYKGYYWVTWACSHIGAIFTNEAFDWQQNPMPIPNFAHVYTEEIISDTVNWITISGTVIADQAYTHLGLGVFFEFELIDTFQILEGPSLGGYYFIDDICVSAYPDCSVVLNTEKQLIDNKIRIYPNPASQHVSIECETPVISCIIYDNGGRVVGSWNPHAEVFTLGLEAISEGMYTLLVTTKDKKTIREKLLIVR